MFTRRILKMIALTRSELQELETLLIEEMKKEFHFFTFDEVKEMLVQQPNQNIHVLSEQDYHHMSYFERDKNVYPQHLMEAYLDKDGDLGIGGYSNRDGYIGNDRCRDTTGLYVWKKQQ